MPRRTQIQIQLAHGGRKYEAVSTLLSSFQQRAFAAFRLQLCLWPLTRTFFRKVHGSTKEPPSCQTPLPVVLQRHKWWQSNKDFFFSRNGPVNTEPPEREKHWSNVPQYKAKWNSNTPKTYRFAASASSSAPTYCLPYFRNAKAHPCRTSSPPTSTFPGDVLHVPTSRPNASSPLPVQTISLLPTIASIALRADWPHLNSTADICRESVASRKLLVRSFTTC